MKIIFHGWYIEIWSTRLFLFVIRISVIIHFILSGLGITKRSREYFPYILKITAKDISSLPAIAFYPFLIMSPMFWKEHPHYKKNIPYMINHEKIHLRQQIELPFGLYFLLQSIDVTCIRKMNKDKRIDSAIIYLQRFDEQEAYLHTHDLDYLKKRKPYAMLFYLKHKNKKEIKLDSIWENINTLKLQEKQL